MNYFLKSLGAALLLAVCALGLHRCNSVATVDHRPYRQTATDLLITDIHVLSADGQRFLPQHNILLRNGQISAISANAIASPGARVIDGRGKYAMPGLIDSHVHLQDSENDLLVYLAHGITHVREMSGSDRHLAWQRAIEKGRPGPSIEVSSEKISSKSGLWGYINELFWTRINISSSKQATALAERLKATGFANAKISSDISRDMYFEISRAARQQQLRVVGHIPEAIDFAEFIRHGQREIAHIEELVKLLNKEFGYFTADNGDAFLAHVNARMNEVAAALRAHRVAVGTTFWYMQSIPRQVSDLPALLAELDLSFTQPDRVAEWLPDENVFANGHAHLQDWWLIFAQANAAVLKALHAHGVTLLAGTDAMTSLVVPGLSMHLELESLVAAGMRPAQAILSATAVPAAWMGVHTGTMAPGYQADLLILNSNPLQDITATRDIFAVINNGRLHPRARLDEMLERVRQAHAE